MKLQNTVSRFEANGHINLQKTILGTINSLEKDGYTEFSILDIVHRIEWGTDYKVEIVEEDIVHPNKISLKRLKRAMSKVKYQEDMGKDGNFYYFKY